MAEREETDYEHGLRNALSSLLTDSPQAFAPFAYCAAPNHDWKQSASNTIDVYWKQAAPLFKIILIEGSKFGTEAGAGSLKWLANIPSYQSAQTEWDFLATYQPVVEHILKAPNGNMDTFGPSGTRYTAHMLQHPSFRDGPAKEMSIFDRLLVLVLLYYFGYTQTEEDAKEIPAHVQVLLRKYISNWTPKPHSFPDSFSIYVALIFVVGPEWGIPPPPEKPQLTRDRISEAGLYHRLVNLLESFRSKKTTRSSSQGPEGSRKRKASA